MISIVRGPGNIFFSNVYFGFNIFKAMIILQVQDQTIPNTLFNKILRLLKTFLY